MLAGGPFIGGGIPPRRFEKNRQQLRAFLVRKTIDFLQDVFESFHAFILSGVDAQVHKIYSRS